MPKREGFIIEQIADMANLRAANKEAQANGKAKKNRFIRRHNANLEANLSELQRMILEEDWPEVVYSPMVVNNDHGKKRKVDRKNFYPWRILEQAIIRVVGIKIWNDLIVDSFACVPGKGLHYGVKRLKKMLRKYPEYKFFWKTDYKKYYHGIPHGLLKEKLESKFKDKRFIRLIEITLLNYSPDPETIEEIEDEYRKTEKRFAHRGKHKSAVWRSSL